MHKYFYPEPLVFFCVKTICRSCTELVFPFPKKKRISFSGFYPFDVSHVTMKNFTRIWRQKKKRKPESARLRVFLMPISTRKKKRDSYKYEENNREKQRKLLQEETVKSNSTPSNQLGDQISIQILFFLSFASGTWSLIVVTTLLWVLGFVRSSFSMLAFYDEHGFSLFEYEC